MSDRRTGSKNDPATAEKDEDFDGQIKQGPSMGPESGIA
jgi:hypothetical protein